MDNFEGYEARLECNVRELEKWIEIEGINDGGME